MVKTPRTRHSKARREALTIDLTAADASPAETQEAPTVFTTPESEDASPHDDRLASATVVAEPQDLANTADQAAAVDAADEPPASAAYAAPRETMADREALADAEADDDGYGFDKTDRPARGPAETSADGPATPPPPRRGLVLPIAAGIAGGIVALLVAGLLQFGGLAGTSADATLNADVEALRQEVETLRTAGTGDIAGRVDALSASLDAAKADIAGVKDAVAAAGGGTGGELQTLDERLKQVEAVVAGLNQGAGAPGSPDVAVLGERIAGVEALVKVATDATNAAADRLAAVEQTVTSLTGRVDAQAQQPKIALAIATTALKSAIDRGTPFLAELETFSAIAPDAPEVAALRPYAETGVSTREALLAESDAAGTAMIAAASPADPDAGLLDRLLDSAGTLVSVKPIGDIQGSGVPETLARMQVALAAGDLGKAIAEYGTLADPARSAGAAFIAKVKARLEAEGLVDRAIANAMKA